MRKLAILLIALAIGGPSFAADMALKAPPAPVATASSWTGFYVGGNVGGGWGSRNVNYSPNDPITVLFFPPPIALAPPQTSFTSSGAVGGPQLGYNWQLNRSWVTIGS